MAEDDLFDSNPASGKAEGAYHPTMAQVPSDAPTPPEVGGPPPRYSGISRSQARARSRYGSGEVTPDDSADIVPPGLILDQTQLSVAPGQSAQFSAIIENQSGRFDHFTLQIKGIPAEWVQELPNRVDLDPGQRSGNLPVTIFPPKTPQSKAGPYAVTVTAISQNNPAQTTDAVLTLNVAPFAEFSSDVWPERIRSGRSVQLTITNKGNSPQNYTLRGRDPDEKVDFEFPRRQVLVEAGQAASSRIGLSARRRPWFREPTEADQASLEVVSPENIVQEHQIDLISTPILNAWWVFPLVLLLCLGGTGAAVWQAWPTPTPTVTTVPPPQPPQLSPDGGGVAEVPTSTPIPTPILPAPTLKFTAIPQTIKQGKPATLKWEAANLVNNDKLFLNHALVSIITNTTNVLTFTTSFTEVSPDFNTTYTLEIQRPPTLTAIVSATLAITVLKQVDVTFGIFPGGGYVPLGYILNGDEFKALGVRLTIEEDTIAKNGAECEARKPAVGLWSDHGSAAYLTTLVPKLIPECEECEKICKSLPLTIHFLRPVREATIFSLKPTNEVRAQIEGSPTATPKNIKLETNFSSPDKDITQVDIGSETQPPAVIMLRYFYVVKEEDTYQDCSACNY